MRRELLRILRSGSRTPSGSAVGGDHTFYGGVGASGPLDDGDGGDATREGAADLPILSLDLNALLVALGLSWPSERWRNNSAEWKRLLHLLYAACLVQLALCAALIRHVAAASGTAAAPPPAPPAPHAGWLGEIMSLLEGDSAFLEVLAASALPGRVLGGLGIGLATPSALADARAPQLPSAVEVVTHGSTQFLQHAALFTHACVADLPSSVLSAAAAEPSELASLLTALQLPAPEALAAAMGSELPSLSSSWIADVRRHAMATAASAQEHRPRGQSAGGVGGIAGAADGSGDACMSTGDAGSGGSGAGGGIAVGAAEVTVGEALSNRCASLGPLPARPPFLPLPTHFSELYNSCIHRKCSVCGTVPVQPAICLLCGVLVCAGSDCCRVNGDEECCTHAQTHHNGIGVYVVVRTTATLLVIGRRYCWWGSLYLDAHGEEDRGLTRGRPLLLARNRLQELTALWQANSLREFLHNNPPPFPHLLLLPQRAT